MIFTMSARTLVVAGAGLLLATTIAVAQTTVRVRGTIEQVDGQTLSIKSKEGPMLKVVLADNAVILGVSVDSVDSHKQFCAKDSLTFKLLADPGKEMISSYGSLAANGAVAARNTFLIDPKGMVRKVYLKVSPNPHSAEVLADLAELQK